jgi:hypothetical protein
LETPRSLIVQPSYELGRFGAGGLSPRLIRLLVPGELEKAGILFAHSFVFCEEDRSSAAEDKASSTGEVMRFPFEGEPTGFISGDWTRVDANGLFLSNSQSAAIHGTRLESRTV